jgi:hypothetical protein
MNAFEMWCSALEEMGENTLMRFARSRRLEGSAIETFFFPHSHYDGIGALATLLRSFEGGFTGEIPRGKDARPPSFWKRLGIFWRDVRSPHKTVVPWKHFEPAKRTGIPSAAGHLVLTEDETARILARVGGASANSRLLWALDQVLTPDVARPLPLHLWMMPVNLRGAVPMKSPYSNYAAQIPVTLTERSQPADVQSAVRAALDEGMHWGAWDSFNFLPRLGEATLRKFVRKYYARPGHAWLGVFSNLGEWRPTSREPQFDWFVLPPVTLAQPIGAGSLTWAGRMTLSIQAHAALTEDPRDAERWLTMWKEAVLAASTG